MTDTDMLFDIGEAVKGSVLTEQADVSAIPVPARMADHITVPLPFTPLTGAALDEKRIFRYLLWRRFAEKGKTCTFALLNPSTADEMKNDPTITRCEGFAKSWGFSRLLVINLFAFRSTDPRKLKWTEDPVGPDNDAWIRKAIGLSEIVVCGWGNHGKLYARDSSVMALIGDKRRFLKKNNNGSFAHPLYLKKNLLPQVVE